MTSNQKTNQPTDNFKLSGEQLHESGGFWSKDKQEPTKQPCQFRAGQSKTRFQLSNLEIQSRYSNPLIPILYYFLKLSKWAKIKYFFRSIWGDFILPPIPLEGSLIVLTIEKGVWLVLRPLGSCVEIFGGFHTYV